MLFVRKYREPCAGYFCGLPWETAGSRLGSFVHTRLDEPVFRTACHSPTCVVAMQQYKTALLLLPPVRARARRETHPVASRKYHREFQGNNGTEKATISSVFPGN